MKQSTYVTIFKWFMYGGGTLLIVGLVNRFYVLNLFSEGLSIVIPSLGFIGLQLGYIVACLGSRALKKEEDLKKGEDLALRKKDPFGIRKHLK